MKTSLRIAIMLLLAAVFNGCATNQIFYRPYDEVKAGMEKMATPSNTQGKSVNLVPRTNAPLDLTVEDLRAAQARRKASPKPDTHQPRSQGCLFSC